MRAYHLQNKDKMFKDIYLLYYHGQSVVFYLSVYTFSVSTVADQNKNMYHARIFAEMNAVLLHRAWIFDQCMRNSSTNSSDSRIWSKNSECTVCFKYFCV